jgi:hypothetical protein
MYRFEWCFGLMLPSSKDWEIVMATRDFLPTKDADLLSWSSNFSAKITATPTAFGLVATQATAFSSLQSAFSTALATATDPVTRTRATIAAKDAAKTPLKNMARDLARVINAYPAITNTQRIALGLNPRSGQISPINPPEECPVMEVISALGRTLKVKLHAQDSNRRGKPDGVDGATVFSFVGEAPPADIAAWKFEGSITKTVFDIEFPATVAAGSQVWLTAFWFNPRSQSGPACQPISAYIAGGVSPAQQQAA